MSSQATAEAVILGGDKRAFASDGTPFDPSSDLWSFQTRSANVVLTFARLRDAA